MGDKTIKLSEKSIFPFGVDNDFLENTEVVAIKGKYHTCHCIEMKNFCLSKDTT